MPAPGLLLHQLDDPRLVVVGIKGRYEVGDDSTSAPIPRAIHFRALIPSSVPQSRGPIQEARIVRRGRAC